LYVPAVVAAAVVAAAVAVSSVYIWQTSAILAIAIQ